MGLLALVTCMAATLAAVRHMRRAPEPFLDPVVFRDRVTRAAVSVSLLTGYALATAIIAAAVWVDRVRYGGPSEQRLFLGALALAMAVGAIGSGYLLRRVSIVALRLIGLGLCHRRASSPRQRLRGHRAGRAARGPRGVRAGVRAHRDAPFHGSRGVPRPRGCTGWPAPR